MRRYSMVLVAWLLTGSAFASGGTALRMGDGFGYIDSYDPARQTVAIGTEKVYLSPSAAAQLAEQLPRQGWGSAERFSAKYVLGRDSGGFAVIREIHVFPKPKTR